MYLAKKFNRISYAVLAALLFSMSAAQAQSQEAQNNQDLQQMKAKLQQLEQEMQALKDEIGSVEHKEESREAPTPVETLIQSNKSEPGEIPTQGKGNTLDLYGFVMLDSGYQFGQNNPSWFDVMRPTQLPSFANQYGGDGNVYFGVRQTRFGVKTSSPTALGDLKTQFEFELFGTGVDAGQTTFRLRQAWGELGAFLAGQTWSPFMDIDVFPNSLEYWGPNGMVFFRNVQIRWTPIRSDRTQLVFALERPGASADGGVYADRIESLGTVTPRFNLPDIDGHVRFTRNWGYVQLASIFRKIGWTDINDPKFNLSGTAYGWGVNVSSNVKFTGKDTGRFQVVYGEGIENYMNDAPIDIGIKNNAGNPLTPIKGVPLPVLGVVSFLDHNWGERFSTSIGYSLVNISNSNAEKPSDYHQGHYALTNLLYHPVKPVTIGGEFQFGRRVNFSDGFNVNDYRVQFSFKYDWGKLFQF
ncbi:MAG TPA: DcaP family trimeric outer membrane transporter [Terriglobales bacterium]